LDEEVGARAGARDDAGGEEGRAAGRDDGDGALAAGRGADGLGADCRAGAADRVGELRLGAGAADRVGVRLGAGTLRGADRCVGAVRLVGAGGSERRTVVRLGVGGCFTVGVSRRGAMVSVRVRLGVGVSTPRVVVLGVERRAAVPRSAGTSAAGRRVAGSVTVVRSVTVLRSAAVPGVGVRRSGVMVRRPSVMPQPAGSTRRSVASPRVSTALRAASVVLGATRRPVVAAPVLGACTPRSTVAGAVRRPVSRAATSCVSDVRDAKLLPVVGERRRAVMPPPAKPRSADLNVYGPRTWSPNAVV
jgi:hypothetical protein